jgi:hypothetical protein
MIPLFSDNKMKIITFPFRISETFQMLDIVSFDMVKQAKRLLWKDPSLHFMEDYTRRVF